MIWVGLVPVCPPLVTWLVPIQHFKAAILDAWRNKVAADLCCRKGFRGGPLLDIHGSLQLLNSSHVRERDKGLLRSVMVGGVWNGFLSGRARLQVEYDRIRGLVSRVHAGVRCVVFRLRMTSALRLLLTVWHPCLIVVSLSTRFHRATSILHENLGVSTTCMLHCTYFTVCTCS